MALTWSITDVANYKEMCYVPSAENPDEVQLDGVTHALIMATLIVGIGKITERNYEEFWCRLEMLGRCNGRYLRWGEKATWQGQRPPKTRSGLTLEMVKAHIGLDTNASFRDEPRKKWFQRVIQPSFEEDVGRDLKEQRRLLADKEAATPTPAPPVTATVANGKIVLPQEGD